MLYILTLGLLAAVPLAQCNASLACETEYITKSGATDMSTTHLFTTFKSTKTAATTTAKAKTTTVYTVTVAKRVTSTSTFYIYTTSAQTTTTIPTTSGFTPFSSYPATISTAGPVPQKRSGASTYATYRSCVSTKTLPSTVYTPTYTSTSTKTAHHPTTTTTTITKTVTSTSTVVTPTQTVYAACYDSENISNEWKGKTVNSWFNYGQRPPQIGISSGDENISIWQAAQQSPIDCCNTAFAIGAFNEGSQSGYIPWGFAWQQSNVNTDGACTLLGPNPYSGEGQSGLFFWTGKVEGQGSQLGVAYDPPLTYEGHCRIKPNSGCPFHS